MHIFFCDFFRDTLPLLVMTPYLTGCVALMFAAEPCDSSFHFFFYIMNFKASEKWDFFFFLWGCIYS